MRQQVLAVYQERIAEVRQKMNAMGRWRGRGKRLELAHRLSYYERAIERIEGNWRGKGRSGVEFGREGHPYQEDLGILGEGSLFELLATTRSEAGAERLAEFLLDPVTLEVARARQDAVRELRDRVDLREAIGLLGKYRFLNCDGERLRDWLGQPVVRIAAWIPVAMAVLGGAGALLMVLGLAQVVLWGQIWQALLFCLGVQAGFCAWLASVVRPQLERLRGLTHEFGVLRQGVELVAEQGFCSELLRKQTEACRESEGARTICRLERLVIALERREGPHFYGISVALGVGTQLVLAIERWRAAHAAQLARWLDAWAEFEALSALAGYAFEHPADCFPELLEGAACLEATELCHPLLRPGDAVGNEIRLGGDCAYYLVSGSNMAGKSTLLRAIGLNAVLAGAGTTVCAAGARMTVFSVCASISVADSLMEAKSRFLAEIERVRMAVEATRDAQPVLFLLDEILSGTNSHDRRIAAEAVLRTLVAHGAVGALSTHDLALTELAERLGGANFHMQSQRSSDPLSFDFRLKPGIAQLSNGLAIVRLMGLLPEERKEAGVGME
jgi:hypothetical protein